MKKLLAVVALFSICGAGYVFYAKKQEEDVLKANQAGLIRVEQNLVIFKLHNGRLPTNGEGLRALEQAPAGLPSWKGPYLTTDKLKDAWGNGLEYKVLDAHSFQIKSAGPDRAWGTADDIIYPQK